MRNRQITARKMQPFFKLAPITSLIMFASCSIGPVFAAPSNSNSSNSVTDAFSGIFFPKSDQNFNKAKLSELSKFSVNPTQIDDLPIVTQNLNKNLSIHITGVQAQKPLTFNQTIMMALQRSPTVTQSIANLSSQNASIDVAKAGYYPQISGGFSSPDLTESKKYGQVLSLNATQMLYDFGKVKSSVNVEQAKRLAAQANVLVDIDQVAYDTASAIVNIMRYESITYIARQQIEGISRIAEITNLRAEAGISTQADPVQAKSNLEAAESNLILQENLLHQYQQKLKTLVGVDIRKLPYPLPIDLIEKADIGSEPIFTKVPHMLAAQTEVEIAKMQKKQAELSNYPTLNLKGGVSKAVNGLHPSNNEDNGTDSSIMLEATSTFYQGGATASRTKAASYAEEAAKARVSSVYLSVIDEIRLLREEIRNKQRQMEVLKERKTTTVRTRELYQEQYKLGTRSAVDLLNAEQAIHSAAQEIENARYDIVAAFIKYISITGQSFDLYDLNNVSIQGFKVQP